MQLYIYTHIQSTYISVYISQLSNLLLAKQKVKKKKIQCLTKKFTPWCFLRREKYTPWQKWVMDTQMRRDKIITRITCV